MTYPEVLWLEKRSIFDRTDYLIHDTPASGREKYIKDTTQANDTTQQILEYLAQAPKLLEAFEQSLAFNKRVTKDES